MSVVRHPTNPEWWQIKYYPKGKKGGLKVEVAKGCSYQEALNYEKKLKSESIRNKKISQFHTFNDVVFDYISYYQARHLSSGSSVVERYLSLWSAFLGNKRLIAIDSQDIEDFIVKRRNDEIKPTTINKELSALSGLMKWAKKRKLIAVVPDIERFPAKMTKAPLPNVPTVEEVMALINCMIWPRCGLFFCLYFGGLRANEARMMRVEDVFLDRGQMYVVGKGNKQRPVPIVDALLPILEKRIGEVGTGLLWTTRSGKPIDDLKNIIKRAKERAGLTRHIYPHLLRHAFGTHCTMNGVSLRSLQDIMGHTTSKTTEIYTTLQQSAVARDLTSKFGKL